DKGLGGMPPRPLSSHQPQAIKNGNSPFEWIQKGGHVIPDDVPDLLPSASAIYARKVGRLTDALNRPEERLEAAEALRALIEKVVLTPGPNRGEIDAMLYGELGTILNWIERQAIGKAEKRNTPGALLTGVSVSVIAGAGLVLNLRQPQVENQSGLVGCFNELFSAHA
ncbi:hypothetical protein PY793_14105, partial [Acetobacter fabarum]